MMKDVIIKETKEPATAIDTPAVTVCIEMVSLYLLQTPAGPNSHSIIVFYRLQGPLKMRI